VSLSQGLSCAYGRIGGIHRMNADQVMFYIRKLYSHVHVIEELTFLNETDWKIFIEGTGYQRKLSYVKDQFVNLENNLYKDFFCCHSLNSDGSDETIETIVEFKKDDKNKYYNFYFQEVRKKQKRELRVTSLTLHDILESNFHEETSAYIEILLHWFTQESCYRLELLLSEDNSHCSHELSFFIK
jgi:hypothetical protein